MKLYTTPCYNPFFIEINSNGYCISTISVFNAKGVVIKENKGWFGSNNSLKKLELDCECVRKLKVDYKCKTAFIVKSDEQLYSREVRYDLYIPESVMQLSEPVYEKVYDDTMIRKSMKSAIDSRISFESYKSIESTLGDIKEKIRVTADSIKNMYNNYDKLEERAKYLIELKGQYDAERARLATISAKPYASIVGF